MDSSAFRHLNLTALVNWPLLTLAGIGLLALVGAAGWFAYWLISHLQWV